MLLVPVVLLAGGFVGSLLVLLWVKVSHTSWGDVGFRRPRSWPRAVLGGIALGIGLKLFCKTLLLPLLGAPPQNAAYHSLVGNPAALPRMLFEVLVVAGVGEEIVWRGFLFERLACWWGRSAGATLAAVVLGAALFGLAHWPGQRLPGMEQAVVTGLVIGALYARTRSLAPVMIAHATFDLLAVAIIYAGWEERLAHLFFR